MLMMHDDASISDLCSGLWVQKAKKQGIVHNSSPKPAYMYMYL